MLITLIINNKSRALGFITLISQIVKGYRQLFLIFRDSKSN